MATMAASFLPKIKCSSCGAGIEISAMGDHVCSPNTDQALIKAEKSASSEVETKPASKSPAPQNSRKSPFRLPSKKRGLANPSVDLPLPQDCAFPTFPTSRSVTPTTPQEPRPPSGDSYHAGSKTAHTAPVSSRRNLGEHVIKRTNEMVSGPFDSDAHPRDSEQPNAIKTRAKGSDKVTAGSQTWVYRRNVPERPSTSSGTLTHDTDLGHSADAQGKHTRQQSSSTPAVSHVRKPSVAAANRPLDEIGSMSSYKPFRFATTVSDSAFAQPIGNPNNVAERKDPRAVGAPPVPPPIQTMGFNQANFTHSPTESRSSNASSASSAHTTRSSQSSPPLSEVGFSSRRKGSDTSRIDNLMVDLQATIAQDTSFRDQSPPHASIRTNAPPSFSRPLYPRSPETTSKSAPTLDLILDSPMDPSMQFGHLSPLPPSPRRTPSPSKMLEANSYTRKPSFTESSVPQFPPVLQQPPASTSPVRRPTTANKGNCRGCGQLIKGKSVSSADGQLTGRYHKDCFVCQTCKEPFKTADFYIMDNNPYCSRHYHQLNGSLCKSCDRGIEGQYLEAETKSKFHPTCFTCRDCRKILANEYFEFNGTVLCEEHARRAAQASLLLNPGRRHPEKRTTRLMMM